MKNREIYIKEHKTNDTRTLYSVCVYGYPEFHYCTWDKEQAETEGIEQAKEWLSQVAENTNELFANIITRIMQFVKKYDFFPTDYYHLLDLQNQYRLDKLDDVDFDEQVYQLSVRWFKPGSVYQK